MEGSSSLVIFTLLGQASAGMLLLLPLFVDAESDRARCAGWVALAMLCVGALASLGHLSDPWVSFYTITNPGTSWLSREIWFVGLFGAATLAWLLTRRVWVRWLAALLGLGLVYVMSRYTRCRRCRSGIRRPRSGPSLPQACFWERRRCCFSTGLPRGVSLKRRKAC